LINTFVIDIFTGAGGLGEGFLSLTDEDGNYPFCPIISVEKDEKAYKTLTLRAFYRLLLKNEKEIPSEYFDYVAVSC
jgi:DNA (cytosine-5)-methyltransferase 1